MIEIKENVHHMKLNKTPFYKMRRGEKSIEIRCNDEKRRKIKVNDIIVFHLADDENEVLLKRVKNLYAFDSFYELYSAFDFAVFGCGDYSMERMLEETARIYPKEKEEKYGALGIEVI